MNAEEQFKKGIKEFRRGNFRGAVESLRGATVEKPQKAKYWANLSLALLKIPNKRKEAEKAILKAIALEHYNPDYYIHLGNIYLQAGMKKRALQQFETALKWDQTNETAQNQIEKLKKK